MDPNSKAMPFYFKVQCEKIRGGKHSLWHAKKDGCSLLGAGNTADNAIKDLQKANRKVKSDRFHTERSE